VRLTRFFVRPLATIACVALLVGCGSDSPTNVVPQLDSTAPPAPEGLSLTYTPEFYRLDWALSAAPDVASYQVYEYAPDPTRENSYVLLGEVSATASSYNLPPVGEDKDTFFKVRAADQAGNRSAYSNPLGAHLVGMGSDEGGGDDPAKDPTEP
jgi:hypothetical protein